MTGIKSTESGFIKSISLLVLLTSTLLVAALLAGTPRLSASTGGVHGDITDFNGDGYEDLAIGIPFEDMSGIPSPGAVSILYGSDAGLKTSSPADQFWHQDTPGVEDSSDKSDRFGASLAPCDFNGDGFSDLSIGQPGERFGNGAVNVIYGSSSGLRTNAAGDGTGRTDQFWTQDSPGVEDAAESDDGFGATIAAGDFDGDGYCDLAIGSPGESLGKDSAGAASVLYGSASGLSSSGDQFWHQDITGVENSAGFGDLFASSLSAGDYNDDGYDDLAVGVPGEKIEGVNGAGAVHVLYGSSSGIQTSSPPDQFWNQNSPGVDDNAEGADSFGFELASGDLNGDGNDDLAITVGREGSRVGEDSGAVNVLYGSSSGLQTSSPSAQFWHRESPGVDDESGTFDGFGSSLAIADFNGDGYGDLGVGVFNDNLATIFGAGATNVLFGSPSGLQTSSPADQFWHQNSPGVDNAAEDGDKFGIALAGGDFNGDGFDDLAIGVSDEDVGEVNNAGAINVLYGADSGLQTSSPQDQFWHQNSPRVNDSAEVDDFYGRVLA